MATITYGLTGGLSREQISLLHEKAIQLIQEVGLGGNFLDHETTLTHYREAFWMPELFEHPMLQQWQQMGSPTLRQRARQIASRKIAEHEYHLPEHIQKELDRIYERARKQFG